MGRPRKDGPRYLFHSQSGRARAVWTDATGRQREQLLPGAFESLESKRAWARFLLDQEKAPKEPIISEKDRDRLPLVTVLDAYHDYARGHYRSANGKPTSEFSEVKLVIRALREAYGREPISEFGPMKLKAVRQGWVVHGLSRKEVNRRTNIARRFFRWAVAEELAPASLIPALEAVTGLQKGRTAARETKPVGPVDDATVDATLPHLNRHVRGLIEFQRYTGCRPGEACLLRMCDVDRTGEVWLFRPTHHKNAHRGKPRVIAIGPKAQEALKPFLVDDPQAYLFSPALAVSEIRAARAAARVTPRYKSHQKRNRGKRVKNPKRAPAPAYTSHSYAVAVLRACDAANPIPAELAPRIVDGKHESHKAWKSRLTPGEWDMVKDWRRKHRWHPNQLRHTFATKVRRVKGLEAAQVLLGHARADVTQIYAEKNEGVAVTIAAEMG